MEPFLIEKLKKSIIQESQISIGKSDVGPDLYLHIDTCLLKEQISFHVHVIIVQKFNLFKMMIYFLI